LPECDCRGYVLLCFLPGLELLNVIAPDPDDGACILLRNFLLFDVTRFAIWYVGGSLVIYLLCHDRGEPHGRLWVP